MAVRACHIAAITAVRRSIAAPEYHAADVRQLYKRGIDIFARADIMRRCEPARAGEQRAAAFLPQLRQLRGAGRRWRLAACGRAGPGGEGERMRAGRRV
ncbi:hypothetical protein ASD67_17570 [Sphingopyxis sp. Root1497]|nr:hypothetical protein ASD67_17570 [Sphingopyxis sp. Root1497]